MKLGLFAALAAHALASAGGSRVRPRTGQKAFVQHVYQYHSSNSSKFYHSSNSSKLGSASPPPTYGSSSCTCIGLDNLEGTTYVEYKGTTFEFPADVGAHCSAWEHDVNPDCKGDKAPDWCHQAWCYVDPCNCNIDVPAKPSEYMEHAEFQGKPIHFSYATCGGYDSWSSDEKKKEAQEADNKALCAKKVDTEEWGKGACKCIGIRGQEGVAQINYKGDFIGYPADVGAHCSDWDHNVHPDCLGDKKKPDWCHERWCYVDPCSCDIEVPSKHSAYQPDAKYRGKPVHYSYATCGGEDSWSTEEMKAQAHDNEHLCEKTEAPYRAQARAEAEARAEARARAEAEPKAKSGARPAEAAAAAAAAGLAGALLLL